MLLQTGDSGSPKRCPINRDALLSRINDASPRLLARISRAPERIAQGLNILYYCSYASSYLQRPPVNAPSKVHLEHHLSLDGSIRGSVFRGVQPGLLEVVNPRHSLCGSKLPPIRRHQ